MMPTWQSMIGADAKPPSGQQLALVMSGDVTEIAKFMFFFICITLTAYGLYRSKCRPQAIPSQASSSPNSSSPPPPTEPSGIPEAVEILNSFETSLEDVLMNVASSDNNAVVPDSTSSNMVVIEMAFFALPAWPQQELS